MTEYLFAAAMTVVIVWVVAEVSQPSGSGSFATLRARAHLLVTVPIYMAWFESEGGR